MGGLRLGGGGPRRAQPQRKARTTTHPSLFASQPFPSLTRPCPSLAYLSTAMPRTRTAVRSAIINRAPHALSPSGATWVATIPRCCVAHSAPWPRPFLLFLSRRGGTSARGDSTPRSTTTPRPPFCMPYTVQYCLYQFRVKAKPHPPPSSTQPFPSRPALPTCTSSTTGAAYAASGA